MNTLPTWEDHRAQWPNAEASRFVEADGLRWHVQVSGAGPAIVLLHGSGAASHSWRDVLPLLATRFTVVVPDLPGHGFTSFPPNANLSLDRMTESVHVLLSVLGIEPCVLVGHSAGGALALSLAQRWPDAVVVGVNAALAVPNALMTALAPAVQSLAGSGVVGFLTARLAESDWVFDSLMRSTGSRISVDQLAWYRVFARSDRHASAVMSMFAEWNLPSLVSRLPQISNRVVLMVGANDAWLPAAATREVATHLPHVEFITLANTGHLAHEELPAIVAETIIATLPQLP